MIPIQTEKEPFKTRKEGGNSHHAYPPACTLIGKAWGQTEADVAASGAEQDRSHFGSPFFLAV